jgi:thioredoxin 1
VAISYAPRLDDRATRTALNQVPYVACLCAAWCRTCDDYRPVFASVVERLRADWPALRSHWIDIEDEAELLGDVDVVDFPTIVVAVEGHALFAGAITPQPSTLERVVRNALSASISAAALPPGEEATFEALARRLEGRADTGASGRGGGRG